MTTLRSDNEIRHGRTGALLHAVARSGWADPTAEHLVPA